MGTTAQAFTSVGAFCNSPKEDDLIPECVLVTNQEGYILEGWAWLTPY